MGAITDGTVYGRALSGKLLHQRGYVRPGKILPDKALNWFHSL
jgi:hypothetical protein